MKSLFLIHLFVLFLLLVQLFPLLGQNHPVVLVVVLVPALSEQLLEHSPHLRVVWTLVESQVPASAQILSELNRVSFAENFNGSGQFLLFDAFVLVPLVVGLQALPGQHASQKVHANIADAFHVISAG